MLKLTQEEFDKMTFEDIRNYNKRVLKEIERMNKHGFYCEPVVGQVFYKDGKRIVFLRVEVYSEPGTDADFGNHFADVQNGNGYYDYNGCYVAYSVDEL